MEQIGTSSSPAGALAPMEPATRGIFLIRHADASTGPKDPELGRHLTKLGMRQAEALAERSARWRLDAIFSSDSYRAQETAHVLRKHHPDSAFIIDPLFREVSRGTIAKELDAPDGALKARLEAVWQKVVDVPFQVSAIVTHNGMIKYLIGRAIHYQTGLKPRFPSASTGITALAVRPGGRTVLRFFNDTSHLTPELVAGPKRPWIVDPTTGSWLF